MPLTHIHRESWTEAELQELDLTKQTTEEETGLYNENGARNRPQKSSTELDRGVYDVEKELTLLDPLYAASGTKLRKALRCLARIESLSFMLFWKKCGVDEATEGADDDTTGSEHLLMYCVNYLTICVLDIVDVS